MESLLNLTLTQFGADCWQNILWQDKILILTYIYMWLLLLKPGIQKLYNYYCQYFDKSLLQNLLKNLLY